MRIVRGGGPRRVGDTVERREHAPERGLAVVACRDEVEALAAAGVIPGLAADHLVER